MRRLARHRGPSLALAAGLLALWAPAALAKGPQLNLTASGGVGGVVQPKLCPTGGPDCDSTATPASLVLGVGFLERYTGHLRAGVRIEAGLGLGNAYGGHAGVLGILGWQNQKMFFETGLGGGLLWLADDVGASASVGILLHAGLGLHFSERLSGILRINLMPGEDLTGGFLGVGVEYRP